MRTMRLLLLATILPSAHAPGADATVLTNLTSIIEACHDLSNTNRAFSLEANLLAYIRRPFTHEWVFTVHVDGVALRVYELNRPGQAAANHDAPMLNDRILLTGVLYDYQGEAYPGYQSATLLARQPLGLADEILPDDFQRDDRLYRPGWTTGIVRDVFRDESDPSYAYLTLICRNALVPAMLRIDNRDDFDPIRYVGAHVRATGYIDDIHRDSARHYDRRVLAISGFDNMTFLSSPTDGDASLQDLSAVKDLPPCAFPVLDRHQCNGTVRAVWHGDNLLVETDDGEDVFVRLLSANVPACGRRVRIVGFPEANSYFISLANASWELNANAAPRPEEPPTAISPVALMTNLLGMAHVAIRPLGKRFRITGVVRYLPRKQSRDARMMLESDDRLVAVDVSSCPEVLDGVMLGSTLDITGTYVLEMAPPGIGNTGGVPRARGFFLVPRDARDRVIRAHPSWWTLGRLLIVIGILSACLAAIFIWNVALARRAERRGQELAEARLAQEVATLKTRESQRLAVELHDSLSQTLTGISMEVATSVDLAESADIKLRQHLGFAARAIDACRTELRNCLWDLRSQALDEKDFATAIRRTLCANLVADRLHIRFPVPRKHLSDSLAHGVLRAIRELVANALRHGQARHIRIAGALDRDRLLFSVRDDGCGFDPTYAPGIAEGHLGLQGIRERFAPLGGTLRIRSAPGKGTKVTISVNLPPRADNGVLLT